MAERVKLAIVGCGGMGRRHLAGLAELSRSDHNNVDLVAVCDLNRQNAEDMADEAEQLMGANVQVFSDAAQMVKEVEGLQAADCTTDTGSHHKAATGLLDLGLHTLCEKPLALTMRGCNLIIDAAERNGKILSVAENYRRDPINRLVRALLDDGAIGDRQFIMETAVRGKDDMFITPWRHQKLFGTLTLDAGVHYADILQYYFGDAATVYGKVRLYEKMRVVRRTAGPGGFYEKWAANLPPTVEATGEDAMFATITFENGALGQWTDHYAGHGEPLSYRMVYGTRGSLNCPGDRNGRPIKMMLDDGVAIDDERILEYAPSYKLDPAAAALFGGERVWSYDLDFTEIDRKLLALEYHEFAECIRTGQQPEVTGAVAKRAVALVYALFESDRTGRPVTIEEIEAVGIDAYQREIDEHLGLV
ncbi:MAG: Gfo/Idh/MocA family oxidoreductase [Thermomicrobiales bacterium]